MPNLASEGNMSFYGWYDDSGLTSLLTSYEITEATVFYGKHYCLNLTVAFDVNGGEGLNETEVSIECRVVYETLPESKMVGHSFVGWFTEKAGGDRVESGSRITNFGNHTLYAH